MTRINYKTTGYG